MLTLTGLDYPFEDPKEGLEFMEELEKSGLVSKEQFEMICSGNAKKLLRLDEVASHESKL